jgi:hypothetical protein
MWRLDEVPAEPATNGDCSSSYTSFRDTISYASWISFLSISRHVLGGSEAHCLIRIKDVETNPGYQDA